MKNNIKFDHFIIKYNLIVKFFFFFLENIIVWVFLENVFHLFGETSCRVSLFAHRGEQQQNL